MRNSVTSHKLCSNSTCPMLLLKPMSMLFQKNTKRTWLTSNFFTAKNLGILPTTLKMGNYASIMRRLDKRSQSSENTQNPWTNDYQANATTLASSSTDNSNKSFTLGMVHQIVQNFLASVSSNMGFSDNPTPLPCI